MVNSTVLVLLLCCRIINGRSISWCTTDVWARAFGCKSGNVPILHSKKLQHTWYVLVVLRTGSQGRVECPKQRHVGRRFRHAREPRESKRKKRESGDMLGEAWWTLPSSLDNYL